MRFPLLTALAMVAFAANSLLNRGALAGGEIGPAAFAAIRVTSGVLVLVLLISLRNQALPRLRLPDWGSVAGLVLYILGFSFAYVSMDAGLGALILFGGVQVTMFLGALVEGERPPVQRWIGMTIAMAGLILLCLPSGPVRLDPTALALMALAALGWGIYSLAGRRATDPLQATTWNFAYALPFVLIALFLWPDTTAATPLGIALAVTSGGLTSALGYALWYSLLPKLGATNGALAQLSVPVIALGLGAVLLAEGLTPTVIAAAAVILGGIAVGIVPLRKS